MNFNHPTIEPFDYIVFGGTGDLSKRKLLPALYHRDLDGQLPETSRIIGSARAEMTRKAFQTLVQKSLEEFVEPDALDKTALKRFLDRLHFVSCDATAARGWPDLAKLLNHEPRAIRVFYLATSPELYGLIADNIHAHKLQTAETRIVLEKPIGHDLASAREINDRVGAVFEERNIFRIDHYLGKETVQNLLVLRFANSLFEPVWNHNGIDHVQITVAETVGVEERGGYYDHTGAMRDMIQNHLMQLLCLVAIEPPSTLEREAVRDEKIKVLKSLAPITQNEISTKTVRGQYRAGAIKGGPVKAYAEEKDIAPGTTTETFAALKVEVKNWRWAGVPFYLRSGKRLPEKVSEIVIQFKPVPYWIFPTGSDQAQPNRLVIRVQPNEHIRLHLWTKEPGPGGLRLRNAPLNLSFAETFKGHLPDAYERLLMDVVRGNATLFMRRDEVEAAWEWTESILDAWKQSGERPKLYTAGTWGPSEAIAMIVRDGRIWFDEQAGDYPGD
ncbi:glucose-6-phosphate dehydrogenase [Acidiphilium acidophilum]|jgi:glucose-6-phosphate 1-dehydrogenase (EC 1.1.1.49)|uniref:Glucose-6-phosphate 1-dehydrogenase n=1 Tax=Acidiphilium acidophilum TaxID=76588 RepID=A0AAW9DPV5_ACIAO|nr:glucose-6-phosphate dehydrogenase [Acidiphilium acidophilum]MDX5930453.1 glucose-6-phosphate dehydrogenase [Acidiphilium acidophilum]GBQ13702.1 glucose-6-phosphate 1-dehydrogenase [Acidiphilium acidophilum DSM 700]